LGFSLALGHAGVVGAFFFSLGGGAFSVVQFGWFMMVVAPTVMEKVCSSLAASGVMSAARFVSFN
jgi:hypothetical protein